MGKRRVFQGTSDHLYTVFLFLPRVGVDWLQTCLSRPFTETCTYNPNASSSQNTKCRSHHADLLSTTARQRPRSRDYPESVLAVQQSDLWKEHQDELDRRWMQWEQDIHSTSRVGCRSNNGQQRIQHVLWYHQCSKLASSAASPSTYIDQRPNLSGFPRLTVSSTFRNQSHSTFLQFRRHNGSIIWEDFIQWHMLPNGRDGRSIYINPQQEEIILRSSGQN